MIFWEWFQSRRVARDACCVALGYWLAATWSDRLWLAACVWFGVTAFVARRRYVEWRGYAPDLERLERLGRRTGARPR